MLRRKGTGGRGGFGWVGGRYDAFPTGFNLSMYLLWLQPLRELGSTKKNGCQKSHLCACSAYLVMMADASTMVRWVDWCDLNKSCALNHQEFVLEVIARHKDFPCAKASRTLGFFWFLELHRFWGLGRRLLCETATEDVEVAGWVCGYHHHVLA